MKNLVRGCLYIMKENKIQLIFFPFYLAYVLVFYIGLGVGADIWDDVIRKMNNESRMD